jgi:hypothetical protein
MANPLTLYVPIRQDVLTQAAAKAAAKDFVQSVQAGLDASGIVHYARLALIPNLSGKGIQALLLVTTFDGPMNPYLQFFWNNPGTQKAFAGIAAIALTPPKPPVTNVTGFENFINKNNLNQPSDLYQAYTKTVKQILNKETSSAGSSKSGSSKAGSGKGGSKKGGSKKGGSKKGASKR